MKLVNTFFKVLLTLYLFGAFITFNFDISKWNSTSRFVMLCISVFVAVTYKAYLHDQKSEIKSNELKYKTL